MEGQRSDRVAPKDPVLSAGRMLPLAASNVCIDSVYTNGRRLVMHAFAFMPCHAMPCHAGPSAGISDPQC